MICIAVLVCIAAPRVGAALDLHSKVDPLAQRLIDEHVAVGFVVGIYKQGATQIIGYGETEKGSGRAPDGNTVYEIGSITKTFTAILLADMIRHGDMKLDTPVQQYLPASVKVALNGGQPITLKHLVTHTSGWPHNPENLFPVDKRNPYADYTVKQLYDFISWRLSRPLGQYQYSNVGMALLGHVLTLQTGKTYEELVIERICLPLAMSETRVNPTDSMRARMAPGYNERLQPSRGYDLPTMGGAGGIRSTVNDMLKYVKANLKSDDTPLGQAIALSHEKLHTMEDGRAIAMAWRISRTGQTLSHTGLTGGYRAWLALVPERDSGVVVLSNTRNHRILQFGDDVTRIAIGLPPSAKPAALTADPE